MDISSDLCLVRSFSKLLINLRRRPACTWRTAPRRSSSIRMLASMTMAIMAITAITAGYHLCTFCRCPDVRHGREPRYFKIVLIFACALSRARFMVVETFLMLINLLRQLQERHERCVQCQVHPECYFSTLS